jgi:RNA polymerase sigma-70 factor (ECF subfamily)
MVANAPDTHKTFNTTHQNLQHEVHSSATPERNARMDLKDPSDFARAYDEHSPGVYRTALRIVRDPALAQDVTQDVFLRLWRRPRTFDENRGELGSYLRLMARSRAVDLWREAQAAGRAGDRLRVVAGSEEGAPEDLPPEALDRQQDRVTLRRALRALPPAQREAVVLAYWGGLTAAEIARRCGVPLGTAKSRIRLGLTRLRDELPQVA